MGEEVRKGQTRKEHNLGCQCLPCKNKRGEPHKTDCQCTTCRASRGEQTGENNPNFGNNWTGAQKIEHSGLVRKKMEGPDIRVKCGSANRGKTFSKKRRENIAKGHLGIRRGAHHTEESKRIIGTKSSQKFTKKFKKEFRKTMEKLGYWIPLEQVKPYLLYCKEADWKGRMFDYLSEGELVLLSQKKLFSNKNTKGVVRDHKYSRCSGFENKVFPIILRHPANCELITHAKNLSKAKKGHRYGDSNSTTLEELFLCIRSYEKDWPEQKKCLDTINKYQNGKRYEAIRGGDAHVR